LKFVGRDEIRLYAIDHYRIRDTLKTNVPMLKFQRNKIVGLFLKNDRFLTARGVLDDDIFGLEIEVDIDLETRVIQALKGRWHREETPECPRAIPFLQEAVGFRIDAPDFERRVNKSVGRRCCPHFANLLIECCDAANEAVAVIQETSGAPDHRPAPRPAEKDSQPAPANGPTSAGAAPAPAPAAAGRFTSDPSILKSGFRVDLHIHSSPASACSSVGVDDAIRAAKRAGLDAVCLTDHNFVWPEKDIEALCIKHDFLVLGGNEITTDQGDILVFGLSKDIRGIIQLPALRRLVEDNGGFMIAAHPFRGFLVFDARQIGLTVETAAARPLFCFVDAVETLNGKVTEAENSFAARVAGRLTLPMTGGSDAHAAAEVGKYATVFEKPIQNQQDLLAALKGGAYAPCRLRSPGASLQDR